MDLVLDSTLTNPSEKCKCNATESQITTPQDLKCLQKLCGGSSGSLSLSLTVARARIRSLFQSQEAKHRMPSPSQSRFQSLNLGSLEGQEMPDTLGNRKHMNNASVSLMLSVSDRRRIFGTATHAVSSRLVRQ
eukprot:s26_g35.t1